ncbi:hypothetical protein [Corynebacterium nasicanis]|uniref:TetR family transcriptional regulator n=1 Tax=Corynebacterium nasicanis TaxID=1448267 RepID=A0ABW1QG40_9CORY
MSVITADRLARIQELSLARAREFFPGAFFLDDTEMMLISVVNAGGSIRLLLEQLEDSEESREQEIVDAYWDSILRVFLEIRNNGS